MNYLFNLRLFYGFPVSGPFADYPAKRGICGLLAHYPVAERLDGSPCLADSPGGGLHGLAADRQGAVTTGSSRCIGSLPYSDATLYAPVEKGRLL